MSWTNTINVLTDSEEMRFDPGKFCKCVMCPVWLSTKRNLAQALVERPDQPGLPVESGGRSEPRIRVASPLLGQIHEGRNAGRC